MALVLGIVGLSAFIVWLIEPVIVLLALGVLYFLVLVFDEGEGW